MDQGSLVPDDVVIRVIEERFKSGIPAAGFILDGFPRTIEQANSLERMLSQNGLRIDTVIYFECKDTVVIERITGRRTCRGCQANFHVKYLPPKRPDTCDSCGGELYQRQDDSESTVRQRLSVYRTQTKDLVKHYKEKNLLKQVDAGKGPDEIYLAIEAVLG